MGDGQLAQLAEILIACHGADAEKAARIRANRCRRRNVPEWATLWRLVADHIREHSDELAGPRTSMNSSQNDISDKRE